MRGNTQMLGKLEVRLEFRRYLVAKCLIAAVVAWSVMTLILQSKGMTFLQIGLLNSFGAVVSLVFEVPMGHLADRLGQKYALTAGAAFTGVGLGVLALSDAIFIIYVSEVIIGIGLALSSGADSAWLFTEHKRLGIEDHYLKTRSAIGSTTIAFSVGGSALGPLLFAWGTNLPLWLSVTCYLAAALTWAGLQRHRLESETDTNKAHNDDEGRAPAGRLARLRVASNRLSASVRASGGFVALAIASTVILTVVSNYSTYIGPFMEQRRLPVEYLGVVLICGDIAQWFAVRHTFRLKRDDDAGRLRVITLVGLVILAVLAAATVFPTRPWAGAVGYVLISAVSSTFFILIDEQMNLVISDRYRATMLSVNAMFGEISTIAVDPLIGAALDQMGFSRTYLLLAAVLAVVFALASALSTRTMQTSLAR